MDVQGKSVEDKSLEIASPPNLVPAYNNSVTGTGDVLKSRRQGLNKQIKPDLECPICQNTVISWIFILIKINVIVNTIYFLKYYSST